MVAVFGKLLFSTMAVLFALFGVGIIQFGRMVSADVRAMEAEATTPAGEVVPGETAEVHGTVEPASEGTVEAPLYGHEAVDAVTEVQRRSDGGTESAAGWTTRHKERLRKPFLVSDDSGTVRVEPPDDVRPVVETEWERFGAGAEDPSEAARDYLATVEGVDLDAGIDVGPVSLGSRQRCGEGTLDPGEEVLVYGRAEEAPANPDGPDVAITGGEDGRFVYSTVDEAELVASTSKLTLLLYGFGALWIVVTLLAGLVPWLVG